MLKANFFIGAGTDKKNAYGKKNRPAPQHKSQYPSRLRFLASLRQSCPASNSTYICTLSCQNRFFCQTKAEAAVFADFLWISWWQITVDSVDRRNQKFKFIIGEIIKSHFHTQSRVFPAVTAQLSRKCVFFRSTSPFVKTMWKKNKNLSQLRSPFRWESFLG